MIKIISSTMGMEKFQRCDHSSSVGTAKLNRAKVLKLKERQKWWGRARGADGPVSGGSGLLIFVGQQVTSMTSL